MTEIRPRIVGTEMEWPAIERKVGSPEQQFSGTSELTNTYLHPDLTAVGWGNMLSNGGRYYLDVGSHLEYATPEDTSFISAVTGELAGERIVMDGLMRYMRDHEKTEQLRLRKRVIDDSGTTWGYHVNLLADRSAIPKATDEHLHLLGLHLATSLPLLGGGAVMRRPDGENWYSLGQKIQSLYHDYICGTMGTDKALINQRDEPLANREKYNRIHITSLDPHISSWATWMALGSCSLILRAIEQGRGTNLRLDETGIEQPLLSLARSNASDLTMKQTKASVGGKTMTAHDLQQELLTIVHATDHTDEEAAVLEEWQRAIDDIATDPFLLVNRSDAITRLDLIQKFVQRSETADTEDVLGPDARRIDSVYDTIFMLKRQSQDETVDKIYQRSFAHRLRLGAMAVCGVAEADISARIFEPPLTTRAYIRGTMIGTRTLKQASWEQATDVEGQKLSFDDPYVADSVTYVTEETA